VLTEIVEIFGESEREPSLRAVWQPNSPAKIDTLTYLFLRNISRAYMKDTAEGSILDNGG